MMWFGKYYEGIITFFTKNQKYLRLAGARWKEGPGQVLRLPSPKYSSVYNPDNDLIWEYETDWTRTRTASDMRTFLPDVRM